LGIDQFQFCTHGGCTQTDSPILHPAPVPQMVRQPEQEGQFLTGYSLQTSKTKIPLAR